MRIIEEELDVNTVESFCFLDTYLVVMFAQLSLLIHIQYSSSNCNVNQTEIWAPDDVRIRPSYQTDPRWTITFPNFWSWRTRIVQDVVSSRGSSIGRSEMTFIVSSIPYVDGLLQNRILRLIGLQKKIHFMTSRSRFNDINRYTFRRETHVKLFRMTSKFRHPEINAAIQIRQSFSRRPIRNFKIDGLAAGFSQSEILCDGSLYNRDDGTLKVNSTLRHFWS